MLQTVIKTERYQPKNAARWSYAIEITLACGHTIRKKASQYYGQTRMKCYWCGIGEPAKQEDQ